jgi:ribonuclease T2
MPNEQRRKPRVAIRGAMIGWAISAAILLGLSVLTAPSARAGDRPGDFDLYVLSLSWSPDYCASHRNDVTQCGADQHFGLVVHGLWPQFASSRVDAASGRPEDWPAHCPGVPASNPPAEVATIWPSAGLFRHEWQTHGTCSGLPMADFVTLTGQMRDRFQAPPLLQPTTADRRMAVGDLRTAILGANPGLPAAGLQLFCRKNRLAEIRLCLGKTADHAYTSCPATMSDEDNCAGNILLHGLDD